MPGRSATAAARIRLARDRSGYGCAWMEAIMTARGGMAPARGACSCTMPALRCELPKIPHMFHHHDEELGVPSHDDRHLFEHLVLEGAQAGLNWELVLKKRDGYRKAFANYDLRKIARFDDAKIDALVQNPAIVRNRQKIASVVANARATLAVQKEPGR